ncbi:MAG TPA: glycosyltransferase family 4 protein [Gaiellaceae bacterium]|nr:glycosyltransferase family 4 protein [Gaiellaceae bacterium]
MGRPRVLVISEIPTPYRLPFFQRLAALDEVRVEVVFCAGAEPDRPWALDGLLAGVPHRILPGLAPVVRTRRGTFVYQVNPGILPLLVRGRFDLLVVGGYAVFAEQVALAFARLRGIPYLLHSESHLLKPRPPWVRAIKRMVLPTVLGGAGGGLAVGSAAARYLAAYGLDPGRIRIVPNTIDVDRYRTAAEAARDRAAEIRADRNLPDGFLLFAGRLVEAKGIPELVEALRLLGRSAPLVVVAGEGPLADELAALPTVRMVGFLQPEALIDFFALADATVVPSRSEPWGVVVNEALACGCPVIASDTVGAAEDLVVEGVNGLIVPAGDASALAAAMGKALPRPDPTKGRIARWNYDFAVEQFVDALRLALPGRIG